MSARLTVREAAVLNFIADEIATGLPPSNFEIRTFFGWKSPNAAQDYIARLTKKGYLRHMPNTSRGLMLTRPAPRFTDAALWQAFPAMVRP